MTSDIAHITTTTEPPPTSHFPHFTESHEENLDQNDLENSDVSSLGGDSVRSQNSVDVSVFSSHFFFLPSFRM